MLDVQRPYMRWLLSSAYFLLSALTAAFISRFVAGPFYRMASALLPVHSPASSVWTDVVVGSILAALLGFLIHWYWSGRRVNWNLGVAKWVWIATGLFLAYGVVVYAPSIMAERGGPYLVRIWKHFSGGDLVHPSSDADFLDVLIYTGTFIKGVAYSIGAVLAERLAWPQRLELTRKNAKLKATVSSKTPGRAEP